MFDTFKADLARYFGGPADARKVAYAFFEMSLWAIAIFRFGKWVQRIGFGPLRKLLLVVYFFLYKIAEALSGIRISSESEIGPGLEIHNFGGVLIKGKIGRNCSVNQGGQIVSRADGRGRGVADAGGRCVRGGGGRRCWGM